MADKVQIGVRYCGGCNPRYDRVALVRRLESFFPEVEVVAAQPGKAYPAVLVACGCTARCADLSGLEADRTVMVSAPEDVERARALLGRPE